MVWSLCQPFIVQLPEVIIIEFVGNRNIVGIPSVIAGLVAANQQYC
jgi:hypothetical protein